MYIQQTVTAWSCIPLFLLGLFLLIASIRQLLLTKQTYQLNKWVLEIYITIILSLICNPSHMLQYIQPRSYLPKLRFGSNTTRKCYTNLLVYHSIYSLSILLGFSVCKLLFCQCLLTGIFLDIYIGLIVYVSSSMNTPTNSSLLLTAL